MNYSKQVPAAERTLRLLEVLAAAPDGLSAGELLEQLPLSHSALFALLNTLKARRYVEQLDSRGRYRLGPALWTLLPGRQPGLGPITEAFYTQTEIATLPETVALAWLDRAETVIIAQIESRRPVRAVFQPGERRPAQATAAGRVLLAGLRRGSVESQSSPELEATLLRVQKEGLAITEDDETVELACPVCPDGIQPVTALLLRMPAFRYRPEADDLTRHLRQGAIRLSYRLGAPVYQPYGWSMGEPLGPTTSLNPAELDQFFQGAWGARLACLRQDGTPHVIPLWYEWDGRLVWVTASPNAYWKAYVKENKRVSVTIDEPWPPLRRVLITGRAEPVSEVDIRGGLAGLRRRLAVRYLGKGAETEAALKQVEGWEAFRILPDKITGQRGLGHQP
ncbi:MAG: pyridoxamine 5'-phosphate oxidase family protein [Chloroflexota bacterium]